MSKRRSIVVDSSIYRDSEPAGFTPTGYKLNVNHPVINHLYKKYKEHNNLPNHFPISDKDRFAFEALIFRMIDSGRIVVTIEEETQ